MPNPTDDAVAQLAADWPRWEIWTVRQYIGGTVWCARRHDDHQRVLNAGTPAELIEMLEGEAAR
jgi:hypothetical protein